MIREICCPRRAGRPLGKAEVMSCWRGSLIISLHELLVQRTPPQYVARAVIDYLVGRLLQYRCSLVAASPVTISPGTDQHVPASGAYRMPVNTVSIAKLHAGVRCQQLPRQRLSTEMAANRRVSSLYYRSSCTPTVTEVYSFPRVYCVNPLVSQQVAVHSLYRYVQP